MGKNSGETFPEQTDNLPHVVATKMVELQDGDTYEMTAEIVKQTVGNREIRRLAYNRMIPGPLLKVEKNAKITLRLTNKIGIETTLHSHGIRLESDQFDGVPDTMGGAQKPMKDGESFDYELNFPDSGIFWYHPHMREDYTQEMGLYGNFSVTEENYWNKVHEEVFLVLDDFSENDPFYKAHSNKTLMGRFGNILMINNDENFVLNLEQYKTTRFFVTNTANTRTFDFEIVDKNIQCIKAPCGRKNLKIVGGDIGRGEREYMADHFIIGPAERYISEARFTMPGTYEIQSRGRVLGTILVEPSDKKLRLAAFDANLRANPDEYALLRKNFQKLLEKPADKKLRISIDMEEMGAMDHEMTPSHDEENSDGIEWEDDMVMMNAMSDSESVEWRLIDETTKKVNMDINDWKFQKDDLIKIEIFNDPESMHPMQHPIHFHGQRFAVITRDEKPVDNLQWKDTTLIRNGERIEIILNTTNPGKWMAHCHIAEHLHAGMMFNFEVR